MVQRTVNAEESTNRTLLTVGIADALEVEEKAHQYSALVLLIIPLLTLIGNVMVIISVCRFRYLKHTINYFILGLAIADLLIALLVMPFAVYVEFNSRNWEIGTLLCDLYCAADVTGSTASIFLLTVISFDRYLAATHPIHYVTHPKSVSYAVFVNVGVWLVSIITASPLVLGLNNVSFREETECRFYNSDFIIYSSLVSFWIPMFVMTYFCIAIWYKIRKQSMKAKQRKALQRKMVIRESKLESFRRFLSPTTAKKEQLNNEYTSDNNRNLTNQTNSPSFYDWKEDKFSVADVPNYEDDEDAAEEWNDFKAERYLAEENKNILQNKQRYDILSKSLSSKSVELTCDSDQLSFNSSKSCDDMKKHKSLRQTNSNESGSSALQLKQTSSSLVRIEKRTERQNLAKQILAAAMAQKTENEIKEYKKKEELSKGMLRRMTMKISKAERNEKKATKTLSIVLGVFIACWLPFFSLNILNAICIKLNNQSCQVGFMPFFFTTWLGYMNSFMNPIIYTVFNMEFRRAFKTLLCIEEKRKFVNGP